MTASSIELGITRVSPFYSGRRATALEQQSARPSPPSGEPISKVSRNLFGKPKPNEAAELYNEEQKRDLKRFRQRYVNIERIETKPEGAAAEAEQRQQTAEKSELEPTSELIERKELRRDQNEGDEVQREKCNLTSAMMSCVAAEITPPPSQNRKRRMAIAGAEPGTAECSGSCSNCCDNGLHAIPSFAAGPTKQSLITDSFVQRKNSSAIKPRSWMTDAVSSSTSPSSTNNSIPPIVAADNRSQKKQHHDQHEVLLPKFKRTVNAADTSTSTYPRICESAPCDTTTTTTSQHKDMLVLSLQITTTEMQQAQQASPSSSSL